MQTFNGFTELADNGQFTENAPGVGGFDQSVPPVNPVQSVPSQLPPPDPQWRKTVDERLGKIERNIEKNMVTKEYLDTTLDTRFTAFEQRITSLIQKQR